jgi:hypothetical protein
VVGYVPEPAVIVVVLITVVKVDDGPVVVPTAIVRVVDDTLLAIGGIHLVLVRAS